MYEVEWGWVLSVYVRFMECLCEIYGVGFEWRICKVDLSV